MTDREIMQQALDALTRIWEDGLENYPVAAHESVMDALRSRLAQPEQVPVACQYAKDVAMPEYRCAGKCQYAQPAQESVAYTTGHCENHKQKGGCQLHNLQCGWPDCDRKPITAPPQPEQEPVAWKQAIRGLTDQCAALIQERDELQKQVWRYEQHGVTCQTYRHKVEQSCSECNVHEHYTAPPQRKPWVGLTDEEEERLIHNFGSDPHTLLDEVNARLKKRNT